MKDPCLIAAWPGMGNVAITSVYYLIKKLGAKQFAEVAPRDFFAPIGATVEKQVISPPVKPTNRFFLYKSNELKHDLLFFVGSVQPIPHKEYEFAREILEFVSSLNVKTVYTTAAAPSDMDFRDMPRVFAVPNQEDLLPRLTEYPVHFMGDGTISGLNGLLISVASELKMKGVCLLGEIPFFTAQLEYPRAALAVLTTLCQILDIKINFDELELLSEKKEKEIAPLAGMLTHNDESPKPETKESKGFKIGDEVIPHQDEPVSKNIRSEIERLFKQAEFDRTYKSKMRLKEELDRNHLFEEYLDRFLDLFKKGTS